MGVIQIKDLAKYFGLVRVFENVSAEIRPGDRIGFIGANGTGKTTFLRCLLGLEEATSGEISRPSEDTFGYVEQQAVEGAGTLYEELLTAYDELLRQKDKMSLLEQQIACAKGAELEDLMKHYGSAAQAFEAGGGYEYEQQINRVITGLGFSNEELQRPVAEFSGGQQTRIALAKALVRQPDYLFLDEPTNHLDLAMVEWLENYLVAYRGGLLIISHDRYFLDKVTEKTWELEGGALDQYQGNYSTYLEKKAARRLAEERAFTKQQAFIAKTEEYILRYKAGIKSKQARGRSKQLSRLERIELAGGQSRFDYFQFNPLGNSAERVLELSGVAAGYNKNLLFKNLSLLIRKGEGVALIGPNGAGKTTLLKLITGEMEAQQGQVKIGSRVKVGYFAQQHENLHPAWKVIEELMLEYGFSEEQSRHYLGVFLFSGDDVFKLVGTLSGGEQARLALLKLMLTGANFLILDEPTNHLDIPAKEAVEDALNAFPGTFFAVSHDRYFLDKVSSRVVELAEGQITDYPGNYSDYRQTQLKREQQAKQDQAPLGSESGTTGGGKAGTGGSKENGKGQVTAACGVVAGGKTGSKANEGKIGGELPDDQVTLGSGSHEATIAEGAGQMPAAPAESSQQKGASGKEKRRGSSGPSLAKLELTIRELEVMIKMKEREINLPENQCDAARCVELDAEQQQMQAELDAAYEAWMERESE
jgi:ATP-binding cassette subfamily F protein 3